MSLVWKVEDKGSEIVVSLTYLCKMGPAAKSSIRIINERGPSQDPWGMPPAKVVQVENSPGNRTLWRRLDRYEWSHLIRQWGTPFAKNLQTNRLWSTLSNALVKSTNMALMDPPASKVEHHWCSIETKAWLVDLPRRAPNWLGSTVELCPITNRSGECTHPLQALWRRTMHNASTAPVGNVCICQLKGWQVDQ